MRFLTVEDLLAVSEAALGATPLVRDWGLLQSALMRPQAVVFGVSVYPDPLLAASALVHSLARNMALVDGNKRTALGALWLFLAFNGVHLVGSDDERFELMLDVAAGDLDDVAAIAERLVSLTEPL